MTTLQNHRIPCLDGLRAIAIGLVIAQHLSSGHTIKILDYLWRYQFGDLGVRIFFVISGFLITSLLIKEKKETGQISLKHFYLRRTLRIFPAYFFFLAVMYGLTLVGIQDATSKDFFGPATFLANYFGTQFFLAHTWSLAVEEQFYLIWSALIVVLGLRKSFGLAALILLCSPLIRIYTTLQIDPTQTLWPRFETAADALALGCLFAAYREQLFQKNMYRTFITSWIPIVLLPVVFALATSHHWPLFWNSIGIVLMNLSIVILLDWNLRKPGSWHHNLLNSRLLSYVGVLSYSLYLWQQPFVYGGLKAIFPYNIILIVSAAYLSYNLIEKPALKLKSKFAPKHEAQNFQNSSASRQTPV